MLYGRISGLLVPEEPLLERLGVLAFTLVFGAWMIHVGRLNVRARVAEEAGKRALFLKLAGRSTRMEGGMAVFMGWMRIVVGVAAIVFGLAFAFFGAFLK